VAGSGNRRGSKFHLTVITADERQSGECGGCARSAVNGNCRLEIASESVKRHARSGRGCDLVPDRVAKTGRPEVAPRVGLSYLECCFDRAKRAIRKRQGADDDATCEVVVGGSQGWSKVED